MNNKIDILVFSDKQQASEYIKNIFVEQINKKNNSNLGFATGTSPLELYKLLVQDHKKNKTNWSSITSFNLDEFVKLDPNHPSSFRKQMFNNLFNHVNIDPKNVNLPDGNAQDLNQSASDYELKLINHRIDLQFISLGANGHIAYNEPPCIPDSSCHVTSLLPNTRHDLMKQGFFNHMDEVPTNAITMGINSILHCKKIIMAVFGEFKALVGKKMVEEEPTPQLPGSYLQKHANCVFIFTEDATKLLDKNKVNLIKIK